MKKITQMLACAWLALFGCVFGLEPADVHISLTRDEADTTLSKDYTAAVLEDGTVRRTWQLENKKLFIDFDTASNEAIMIAIVYNKPVSKKIGLEDVNALAENKYEKNAKWDAPKDRASREKVEREMGMKNARRKKMEGSAVAFYETQDKKDLITRVSVFAHTPHKNRWILAETRGDGRRTALGNQMGNSHIKELYKDEMRRKTIPLAMAGQPAEKIDASTPAEKTAEVPVVTITHKTTKRPSPKNPAPHAKPAVATSSPSPSGAEPQHPIQTAPTKPQVTVIEGVEESEQSAMPPPPEWLKQLGIEDPTWGHVVGLGVIALLLLIFILRAIIGGASKAAQRKRFEKILSGEEDEDEES